MSFDQFLRDFLNGERECGLWLAQCICVWGSLITSDSGLFSYGPLMMAVKPSFPQKRGEWLRKKTNKNKQTQKYFLREAHRPTKPCWALKKMEIPFPCLLLQSSDVFRKSWSANPIKPWQDLTHAPAAFCLPSVPHGSWFEHVQGWMEMKDQENFFFITYEELKQVETLADPPAPNVLMCHKPLSANRHHLFPQDLQGSVRRICQFLGQDLDDAAVSSVVRNASFSAMRENPMCSSVLLPADIMDQTKGQFLRKGEQGGPMEGEAVGLWCPQGDRQTEGVWRAIAPAFGNIEWGPWGRYLILDSPSGW